MKKKLFFTVMLVFVLMINVMAQQNGIMTFATVNHHFGTVKQEDGDLEYEFLFSNTGNASILISDVSTSCDCTVPEWTSEEVLPGKTGKIKAQFDPYNKPGPFSKTITVTSNAEPSVVVLTIEGYVQPLPRTVEEDFPMQLGRLRVQYPVFNFGNINTREPVVKDFEVYNGSDSVLIFEDKVIGPSHIKVSYLPQALKPKSRGVVRLTYDAVAKNDLGYVSDNVVIFTDEKKNQRKEFSVMATIEEYFAPLTQEEMEKAPKAGFNMVNHDFGSAKKGEVLKVEFPFANTGKSELNIRKIKPNCDCVIASASKQTLAPGESAVISVSFDTKGREGTQYKSVTVFSNDPTRPTLVLSLKAALK
jgi:hypothetical protein